MLVYVRSDDAELAPRHQCAETLAPYRASGFDEGRIAVDLAEVIFSRSVVRLVPIWRAGDHKAHAGVGNPLEVAAVAVDHLERFEIWAVSVLQSTARALD